MSELDRLLKSEIARLARKETKNDLKGLRSALAQQRSAISALRKQVEGLEKVLGRVRSADGAGAAGRKGRPQGESDAGTPEEGGSGLRFSAKGLAAKREKLGLSAAAAGLLLGVSPLSVYKWESGKTRPRAKQLGAIAEFRKLGKREAMKRLESASA